MAQIHMILFMCKLSIQVGDHGLAQLVRTVLLEHSANNAKIKGSVPVSDPSFRSWTLWSLQVPSNLEYEISELGIAVKTTQKVEINVLFLFSQL